MSENPQPLNQQVNTSGGAFVGGHVDTKVFVGRDNIQYVVSSLDDVPLAPEEMQRLLTLYRQRLLAETQYVKLEGIPLPDESLASAIPLQRVYIRIQAIEQRESQKLRRAEEQALLEPVGDKQGTSDRLDLFDLISRFGEYLYRRGESVESSQRPDPVDPLEAIRDHRHLVLLGAPGAGKSTLLRYLANQTAKGEQAKIPILVFLGAFALTYSQDRQLSLHEWAICNAAPDDNDLRRALRQATVGGKVLWLFDGLDEAGDLREEISRQIGQIASHAQVVVTSRPLDYRRTHLESFAHFEALPLTTANVEQFITDWLTILAERQGHTPRWVKECSDWLQKQLAERPRIQTLTQNPLLLTFLVILARHDPRQDLPIRRSDLYRRYVEELFSAWEQRRQPETIKLSKALYMRGIEAIAWYLHLAYFGRSYDATEEKSTKNTPNRNYLQIQLANVLRSDGANSGLNADETSTQIIDFWLGAGLIEKRQWPQWELITFRHLTFQEYSVSSVLHTAWQKDAERTWQFLKPRLHHFAWRESLLLLAEQMEMPSIDQLLGYLLRHPSPYDRTLQRDLYLAATLAGENKSASERVIQQIIKRLTWHIRSHLLELRLIGSLWGVLTLMGSFTIARILQIQLWEASLIGLFTLIAISLIIWRILAIRSLFLLPIRLWLSNVAMNRFIAGTLAQLGDVALKPLIGALNDADSHVRREAAEALAWLGDRRAVEPLVDALNDADIWVRWRAVEALAQLGDRRAFERLVGALNHIYSDVRLRAVEALAQLGDVAIEPLAGALNHSDSDVRLRAVEALAQLGDVAIEPLAGALNHSDSDVHRVAAEALTRLRDRRAIEPLVTALNDADSAVRLKAAEALTQLRDRRAIEPLVTALNDADSAVRLKAAEALTQLRDRRAIEPLVTALNDADIWVRWRAVEALSQLGDVAIEQLIDALNHSDRHVRLRAVGALAQLGDRRAVEPLVGALNDVDIWMHLRAAEALAQLGNRRAVEPLVGALNNRDSNVRLRAAEALARLGDRRAVEPLVGALNHSDRDVRSRAVEALTHLGDVALKPLVGALNDRDIRVRLRAVGALTQLGDRRAVEPLVGALNDRDSNVRLRAVGALTQLGDVVLKPLVGALNHSDSQVRRGAVEALARLGDRRAVEPLVGALNHSDSHVRRGAAEALTQLSGRYVKPKKVAYALWWQLTDPGATIDEAIFSALASVVSQFPVTDPIDDLLLPTQPTSRHRVRWWIGAFLVALLALAVSAGTGVLGNLLTDWLSIDSLQGLPLAIAVTLLIIVSLALLIISQVTSNNSE